MEVTPSSAIPEVVGMIYSYMKPGDQAIGPAATVGPMKKFRNKKEMFARIAENLNKTMRIMRTGEQCCSRFNTVITRKTSATVHNKNSGNSPSEVSYDEELAKIADVGDSVEPEELRDGYIVVSRKFTGSESRKKGSSSGEAEETLDGSQIDEESQSSPNAPWLLQSITTDPRKLGTIVFCKPRAPFGPHFRSGGTIFLQFRALWRFSQRSGARSLTAAARRRASPEFFPGDGGFNPGYGLRSRLTSSGYHGCHPGGPGCPYRT
ncbi:hypothetical protein HPB49_025233 [Dermacentor silvarum]|uniref:Uncharacterized protein n=1 Tax=Dermacentor silvarum TaxID=543639 RepID=A0ACB8D8W7_DERSI|nr:hypothetical protein HPB49_025233 [Dermacentor silvarum]